jgi:hypothetical protein
MAGLNGGWSMRGFAILVFTAAISVAVPSAVFAEAKIRLAQSSAVTNCMMTCNATAATCQTNCLLPPPPSNTANPGITSNLTATTNPTLNTACQLNCTSTQLTCQTVCARQSP